MGLTASLDVSGREKPLVPAGIQILDRPFRRLRTIYITLSRLPIALSYLIMFAFLNETRKDKNLNRMLPTMRKKKTLSAILLCYSLFPKT